VREEIQSPDQPARRRKRLAACWEARGASAVSAHAAGQFHAMHAACALCRLLSQWLGLKDYRYVSGCFTFGGPIPILVPVIYIVPAKAHEGNVRPAKSALIRDAQDSGRALRTAPQASPPAPTVRAPSFSPTGPEQIVSSAIVRTHRSAHRPPQSRFVPRMATITSTKIRLGDPIRCNWTGAVGRWCGSRSTSTSGMSAAMETGSHSAAAR